MFSSPNGYHDWVRCILKKKYNKIKYRLGFNRSIVSIHFVYGAIYTDLLLVLIPMKSVTQIRINKNKTCKKNYQILEMEKMKEKGIMSKKKNVYSIQF